MLKEAKKVPAIRFSGFTDSWEQRKLNEVLDLLKDGTHGTHQDADEGPLLLSAKNIKNGEIVWDDSDRRISIEEYKSIHSNFQLQPDDILLTIVGSIGETAILRNPQGLTFQRSVAFLRPDKHINSEFMCSEIQSTRFQNELRKRKSTSAQPGIYLGDLQEIPFIFPANPDEQRNISSCFCNLDNLITLHQRKLEQLKKLKKYFLQNMFPAKGEKVPKIRLKGFTSDWEQHNLGEITSKIGSGKTPSGGAKAYVNQGTILIRSQNVHDDMVDFSDVVFIDDETNKSMKNSIVVINDILLNITGASIGRSAVYKSMKSANVNQHVCIIRPISGYYSDFIQLYISSENGQKQIDLSQAGGGREGLNFQQISKFEFAFPSYDEQVKIGEYFRYTNDLIACNQHKIEKLRTLKKYMLQNMFI